MIQDLVDRHISKNNVKVLQMLNTKYVIQGANKKPQELPALGNAWFVNKVVKVNSPDEEIDFLKEPEFTPNTVAVIDESKFNTNKESYSNTGTIELTKYQPNKMVYKAKTDNEGLAVFSEVFYPVGWNVSIDGKPVEMKRVNYILRALEIPTGSHDIIFEFKPSSYYTGEKVALFGSILVILILIGGIIMEVKTQKISFN